MIPFNIFGHTYTNNSEPIVWVDAQDTSTYTLSGNDVLTLDNKGTLGGTMSLNGNVKFANGGFESWSSNEDNFITFDLNEPFLTNNDFTMSFTFNIQDLIGGVSLYNTIGAITSDIDNDNSIGTLFSDNGVIDAWHKGSNIGTDYNKPLTYGLKTIVFSYNYRTSSLTKLHYQNGVDTNVATFDNIDNNLISLLNSNVTGWGESGAYNPLHEFRLYSRAMSLQQMQDLQNELNNKYSEPIVWVDSSDTSTYTLNGNIVTSLSNKGSLGGAMTLNGSVKFENSGFESWASSSYITRNLGENFLTDNSFTIVTCFDFQNINQQSSRGWWSSIYNDINNRIGHFRLGGDMYNQSVSSSNTNINQTAYSLGVQTLVSSYDYDTNTLMLMNFDGTNDTFTSVTYYNVANTIIWLLRSGAASTTSSGQDNPLHEFRLYDRAFSLTEMQNLQTELNNKYSKPTIWLDSSDNSSKKTTEFYVGKTDSDLIVNGDFSNGNTDWTTSGNVIIESGYIENNGPNGGVYQSAGITANTKYLVEFEIIEIDNGGVKVWFNGDNIEGTTRNEIGIYQEIITSGAGANGNVSLGGIFSGKVSNLSVKEVTQDDYVINGNFDEEVGTELLTNGDFSNGNSDWTLSSGASINSGIVFLNNLGTSNALVYIIQNSVFPTQYSYYKLTYDVVSTNGATLELEIGSGGSNIDLDTTTTGSKTLYFFFSTNTSNRLQIKRGDSECSIELDNISLKEDLTTRGFSLSGGGSKSYDSTTGGMRVKYISSPTLIRVTDSLGSVAGVLEEGKIYRVEYEVKGNPSGTFIWYNGSSYGTMDTSVGYHVIDYVKVNNTVQTFLFRTDDVNGDVIFDNFSITERVGGFLIEPVNKGTSEIDTFNIGGEVIANSDSWEVWDYTSWLDIYLNKSYSNESFTFALCTTFNNPWNTNSSYYSCELKVNNQNYMRWYNNRLTSYQEPYTKMNDTNSPFGTDVWFGTRSIILSVDAKRGVVNKINSNGDTSYLRVASTLDGFGGTEDMVLTILNNSTHLSSFFKENKFHELKMWDRVLTNEEMVYEREKLLIKHNTEPIVWVDSSDTSTYTLSGSDVLTLDNKGTLGGTMSLNGSVKFANNGFESWSVNDYINYNLSDNFLNSDKDFTIAITFNLTNLTSGHDTNFNYFLDFNNTNNRNLVSYSRYQTNTRIPVIKSNNIVGTANVPNIEGVNTLLCTYSYSTNTFTYIERDGSSGTLPVNFNSTQNQVINLLKHTTLDINSGADNPLHEFRLYKRALSLTEMQDLQTELNNKYSEPIVWVDAQDISTYTLNGNDVTSLTNKGTLGGTMSLNGSVKFANNGFESWSTSTSISKTLSETFLPTNSFTFVTTFDYSNKKSNNDVFSTLFATTSNRVVTITNGTTITPSFGSASSNAFSFGGDVFTVPTGVMTLICTYDVNTNIITYLSEFGNSGSQNIGLFNNTNDASVYLLNANAFNLYSGQNNPLHEFRLYDRAFSLTEMQDLQIELNNKYTP